MITERVFGSQRPDHVGFREGALGAHELNKFAEQAVAGFGAVMSVT